MIYPLSFYDKSRIIRIYHDLSGLTLAVTPEVSIFAIVFNLYHPLTMKRSFITLLITVAACLLYACSQSSAKLPAITPNTSAPVAPQAASLVADNDRHSAARRLVEWLADTPVADRDFAKEYTREIYRLYSVASDSGSLSSFASTLEKAKDSLPLHKQVNVFVAVSSPSTLGHMLRNDPQADTIASLIVKRYDADTASVNSFLKAYHSR